MSEVLDTPVEQLLSVAPDHGEDITIAAGEVVSGFNYRRRYNEAKMAELVTSMKANGQLQGLVLRLLDDGRVQVLAGNRRLMAFIRAFGPAAKMYGKVRTYTDVEALAVMVSENGHREDPTAIEDAEAATRLLGELKGDKNETALRLGWKRPLLDRRLAIMNAIDGVRDAFIDEKLDLGHVEILAAMPREAQEKVLEKLLAAPVVPTVPQLKAMAEQVLLSLEAAVFEKSDCAGCKFNTGNQQALFDTSFAGTLCTNSGCYNGKTESELELRRLKLNETYQVVKIVRPGDNQTVKPLRAEGKLGVGVDQANACKTCQDFGACVSAVPDQLGMEFKEVCFNTTCLTEKASLHANAILEAAKAASAKVDQAASDAISKAASGAAAGTAKAGQGASSGKAKQAAQASRPTASSEPRTAVKEYREKIWRGVFHRAALKLTPERSRGLLMALCLYRPSAIDRHGAAKAIEREAGLEGINQFSAEELATKVLQLDMNGLTAGLYQLPAFVDTTLEIQAVVGLLKALDVKIESHWKVNAPFFDLLHIGEISAICTEIGIEAAIGKDFAKLTKGGKPNLIKAITEIKGFEYVGKIPALMRW